MISQDASLHSADIKAASAPIAQIDGFLLALRWGIIGALGIMATLQGFGGAIMALPMAVWLGIVAYNIPLSIFTFRNRPLMHRSAHELLLGDLVQASVAVLLTGGWRSPYFMLFTLLMAELALIWRWKRAFLFMFAIAGLQVAVMVWGEPLREEAFATYLITGKLFLSLLVGSLSIVFGELARKEEAARLEAARRARRMTILNDVLSQINENGLDRATIMKALVHGANNLVGAHYTLLLTPGANAWCVSASTDDHHPVDDCLPSFQIDETAHGFHIIDKASELPAFAQEDGLQQIAYFFLRNTAGALLGLLLMGWTKPYPLDDVDEHFLLSLSQEASMALRNAQLYAEEQQHIVRLNRFDHRQSIFFSAIGHELKTPIAILKMLLSSLQNCQQLPQDAQSEVMETFEQNLNRLESLTADWLESARLESGAVSLYRQEVDMTKLARTLLSNLRLFWNSGGSNWKEKRVEYDVNRFHR